MGGICHHLPTQSWGLGGASPFFSILSACHYQGVVQFLFAWTTPVDFRGGHKEVGTAQIVNANVLQVLLVLFSLDVPHRLQQNGVLV